MSCSPCLLPLSIQPSLLVRDYIVSCDGWYAVRSQARRLWYLRGGGGSSLSLTKGPCFCVFSHPLPCRELQLRSDIRITLFRQYMGNDRFPLKYDVLHHIRVSIQSLVRSGTRSALLLRPRGLYNGSHLVTVRLSASHCSFGC